MTNDKDVKRRNLLLIALLATVTFFTAYHEGYIGKITTPFWFVLIAGFALCVWIALSVSTKRLVSLILGIFIIEYIKETIGVRADIWKYRGNDGSYNFGVWVWVLGAVGAYTLSVKIVIKLVKKLKLSLPRWLNPVILVLIAMLIPLTLGSYWSGVKGEGVLFFSFYALLLIGGIYASARMGFPVFIGIVIAAWFGGNLSEYVGSVHGGILFFTKNPNYPPFYLIFGCWPLEILAQYSLSAFLAGEPLD